MMWKVGYEWLWEREGGEVETVFMLKSYVFWML
jgi:hypothetical protein